VISPQNYEADAICDEPVPAEVVEQVEQQQQDLFDEADGPAAQE
jgi:hypothetical protein